jgi:(1->4)-alpha-D-glucan 1-alpha-D-glucosylmutase
MLREGPSSPYASWFDVDWDAAGDRVVVPVLAAPSTRRWRGRVTLADGRRAERDETVRALLRPRAAGPARTEDLPLAELLDRQWWRLESWRAGASTLNYRRFFDVGSLARSGSRTPTCSTPPTAARRPDPRGSVDGLRIDHPDGLADPRGYLRRLAEATDDAWVVVEKILEGDERLPDDWPCAGTTGYDLLWRIGALFVDPAGEEPADRPAGPRPARGSPSTRS